MTHRRGRRRSWPLVGLAATLVLTGCGHSSSVAKGPALTRTHDVGAAYDAALAGLDPQFFDGMEMSSPTARG